jgi:hypothetical protein
LLRLRGLPHVQTVSSLHLVNFHPICDWAIEIKLFLLSEFHWNSEITNPNLP